MSNEQACPAQFKKNRLQIAWRYVLGSGELVAANSTRLAC
jgi:hypothetical protein